jgi:uncharacterized protein VirK/YbjX
MNDALKSGFLCIVRAYIRKAPHWRPVDIFRRCAIVSRLLFLHPIASYKIIRTLSRSTLLSLAQQDPIILLKFSFPSVYARGLSIANRAAIIANHYGVLQRRLKRDFIDKLIREQATLWESSVEGCSLAICLNVTAPTYGQGELSLRLRANNADIYELCFVIAPAHLLGVNSDQVIFVTGLQGTKGCADLIKLATKSIGDVGPRLVLIAALQGIAVALNIRHIVGISSTEQVSAAIKPPDSNFVSIYDEFWASIHGTRLASGCFQLPVPVPRKPLLLIRRNHRLRARERRVVKDTVMNVVREHVKSAVLLEPQTSS